MFKHADSLPASELLQDSLTVFVSVDRKETLSLEKLEAQLKACLCRIAFSKAKVGIPDLSWEKLLLTAPRHKPAVTVPPLLVLQPSVLALALLRQEIEALQWEDMLEVACYIQAHLKVL